MRTKLLLPAVLAVALAGCGASGAATQAPAQSGVATSAPTHAPAATDASTQAPAANGSVDCTKVKAALADLIVPIQLMAQIHDPSAVDSFEKGTIGPKLDPDKILADLADLHALDSVSTPLGDPKAAISAYEDTANALKTLFATSPATQAAVDTYNQHVGEMTTFLMHQSAISAAMDEAHC
jgi:glucose/arabinose dehydrogenase